jgi:hypothetical protein
MKIKVGVFLVLLSVFLSLPLTAQTFTPVGLSAAYQLLRSTTCNASGCNPASPTQSINTTVAIGYYKLSWSISGTVTGCTASVDNSSNGAGVWTPGGVISAANITCTAMGSYTTPSGNFVDLVRIGNNSSSSSAFPTITCTGSCSVTFTLIGFIQKPGSTGSGT